MVFVQPFAIDFRYETEHVIAFCSGHPEYEAVEAFIARRSTRGPRIRAILTRHDMSQVDHINEGEVVRERRAIDPTRETYHAPIAFEQTTAGALRDSVLRFSSYKGETIVLELVAAFPADPALADRHITGNTSGCGDRRAPWRLGPPGSPSTTFRTRFRSSSRRPTSSE